MSDRARAWCWVAYCIIAIVIEWAFHTLWRDWFFAVANGHWIAVAFAAYYFGRHNGRRGGGQDDRR